MPYEIKCKRCNYYRLAEDLFLAKLIRMAHNNVSHHQTLNYYKGDITITRIKREDYVDGTAGYNSLKEATSHKEYWPIYINTKNIIKENCEKAKALSSQHFLLCLERIGLEDNRVVYKLLAG